MTNPAPQASGIALTKAECAILIEALNALDSDLIAEYSSAYAGGLPAECAAGKLAASRTLGLRLISVESVLKDAP